MVAGVSLAQSSTVIVTYKGDTVEEEEDAVVATEADEAMLVDEAGTVEVERVDWAAAPVTAAAAAAAALTFMSKMKVLRLELDM